METTVVIENQANLGAICGPNDTNLFVMSELLGVRVYCRGNRALIATSDTSVTLLFKALMKTVEETVQQGAVLEEKLIRSLYASLKEEEHPYDVNEIAIDIPGGRFRVIPRNTAQSLYFKSLGKSDLVFAVGPAGTGKTYIAVASALKEVLSKERRKLVLTRPVVEAGESLGYLPGDLTQKLGPYLRPLYDAVEDIIPPETFARLEENRMVELAPLAYMRGRSLNNSFVILDEAQNATREQMLMFLTRLGENTRAVVTGDLTQTDLGDPSRSGLKGALRVLKGIKGVAIHAFSAPDIVRSPLVKRIIHAYDRDRNQ